MYPLIAFKIAIFISGVISGDYLPQQKLFSELGQNDWIAHGIAH